MARFSRVKFFAALMGIIILFAAGAILLLIAALKPGMKLNLDLQAGKGNGNGIGNPVMDFIARKVLRGRVGMRSLEYVGGTRLRLNNLDLRLDGDQQKATLIDAAELEVVVPSMSLKGELDIASVIGAVLDKFLVGLHLVKGKSMRARVLVPVGALDALPSWTFHTDLGGQVLNWEPIPTLAPIPLAIESGKISFEHGILNLENVRVVVLGSRLDLNVKAENVGKPNAEFKPSIMAAKLNLGQLIRTKDEPTKQISNGAVDARISLQGPLKKPVVTGIMTGNANVPYLPLDVIKAGQRNRSIQMFLNNVRGSVNGGAPNEDVIAKVAASVQNAQTIFHSMSKTFGYSSTSAQGLLTMLGSWGAPKFKQVLNFEHGVVKYGFGFTGDGQPMTNDAELLKFPYERLAIEVLIEDNVFGFRFDGQKFLNGNVHAELGYARNRKPRPAVYNFDGTTLSLDQLSQIVLGPNLAMHGVADVHARGDASALYFHAMNGTGEGTIRDFSLDWRPSVLAKPDDQAIANLVRRAIVPIVQVKYPQFGRGVTFSFEGRSPQYNTSALITFTHNLDVMGTVQYAFSPGFVTSVPGADSALRHIGYNQALTVKLKGTMGAAEIELLAR